MPLDQSKWKSTFVFQDVDFLADFALSRSFKCVNTCDLLEVSSAVIEANAINYLLPLWLPTRALFLDIVLVPKLIILSRFIIFTLRMLGSGPNDSLCSPSTGHCDTWFFGGVKPVSLI